MEFCTLGLLCSWACTGAGTSQWQHPGGHQREGGYWLSLKQLLIGHTGSPNTEGCRTWSKVTQPVGVGAPHPRSSHPPLPTQSTRHEHKEAPEVPSRPSCLELRTMCSGQTGCFLVGLSLDSKLNTPWPLKPDPLRPALCQLLSRHLEKRPPRVLPGTARHVGLAAAFSGHEHSRDILSIGF